MLNLIDEHSRECLMVRCERRRSSAKVIEALADVMVMKGVPEHLRSDNGPEFVAHDLRQWLANTGAKTSYIEPGSPWEDGFCESFNSKLRDEFLNGEIFYSMKEIRVLAERWRIHYNTLRPHSSLGGERWNSRFAPAIPSCQNLQRSETRDRCATLTSNLVQKIGQTTLR
jgi:putative transposase